MKKLFTLLAICVMAVTSASASTDPDYVEIGGLRWATMNLGATTVAGTTTNPESAFGTYYSWGATSTIVSSIPWSSLSSWGTSLTPTFSKDGGYTQANDPNYSSYTPTTGTTRSADFDSHDAAKAVLGGNWRMPSADEFKALADACGGASSAQTSAFTGSTIDAGGIYWIEPTKGSSVTIDGVAYSVPGRLFVDKTDVNKRVFFPATGFIDGTTLGGAGTAGLYCSSSLMSTSNAYLLYFYRGGGVQQYNHYRYCGFSVRAVQDIPSGINGVDANADVNKAKGVVKTPNYIIKDGKKYNYAGQRVK